jgi:D-glycero-alpha-D-manno-heptose 1-phosphate guanylyltransferase
LIGRFIKDHYPALNYIVSVEQEPLGTGGAVKLACMRTEAENILVLNGDTLYKIDLAAVANFNFSHQADCTLTLKPMQDFDRYGAVETDAGGQVKDFKEKQFLHKGLINGGVYALNRTAFLNQYLPDKFSFEKDYLEAQVKQAKHRIFGMVQEQYFIDIGIPEDFNRAQKEV